MLKIFDVTHLQALIEKKNYDEANTYLSNYFFKSGTFIYFKGNDGTFTQYKPVEAKILIPDDLKQFKTFQGKTVVEYDPKSYLGSTKFKSTDYQPTIDFSSNEIVRKRNKYGAMINYLNMARPAPDFGKIKANRAALQDDLNTVYSHIKTVWANNNDDVYEWIMNFIACSIAGRKLRQALYLPCEHERTGRGSIINFLERMLGDRMLKTSATEDVVKYTKPLEGRTLINLDEMPLDSGDFRSIGDSLKSLITEPYFSCRDMHKTAYKQKNTFNIIITSNNDAVLMTQSNNKRYFIADINTVHKGDLTYFTKLNNILKNKKIEKLFYEDLMIRFKSKCTSWNEDITPETTAKQEKLICSLPTFTKWFKDSYALRKKDLNMKQPEFFDDYYRETKDKTSKIKIGKILKSLGIHPITKTTDDKTFKQYEATGESIYQSFMNNKWIDENVDSLIYDDDDNDFIDEYDNGIKYVERSQYDELMKKYKELENKTINDQFDKQLELVESNKEMENKINDLIRKNRELEESNKELDDKYNDMVGGTSEQELGESKNQNKIKKSQDVKICLNLLE